jgi:hypothetical protein
VFPLLAAGALPVREAPASAAYVPESSLAFFAVDLDLESAQWRQAAALLARVGFPNALEDLRTSLVSAIGSSVPAAEATLDAVLGGEAAIVVTEDAAKLLATMPAARDAAVPAATPVGAPAGIGVAAVLLPGDADAAWATIEDLLARQAGRQAVTIEETAYRGATILSLPPEPFADAGIAVASQGAAILAAGFPADLEPLIDTAAGDGPSLADSGALADEALLFGFVDGAALLNALGPEVMEQLRSAMPQAAALGTLGTASGVALWADDQGFRLDTISLLPTGGEMPDLPENADLTWDERVPDDTLFFRSGIAGPGTFDGAALLLALAIGGASGQIAATDFAAGFLEEFVDDQLALAEQVLGFDPRADLFDHLAGEHVVAGSVGGLLTSPVTLGVSAVAAIAVDDSRVVAGSIDKIARLIELQGSGSIDMTIRLVEGDTVHVLQAVTPDVPPIPLVEFGVVDEVLVIGAGPGSDQFVNGPRRSLAEDEQCRRVLATLPASYFQVTYFDIGQLAPLFRLATPSPGPDIDDADEACATYTTQPAAQAAFDAAPLANSNLDRDFDGRACEDFFAEEQAGAPVMTVNYAAFEAFAAVSYRGEGVIGSSPIHYIGGT